MSGSLKAALAAVFILVVLAMVGTFVVEVISAQNQPQQQYVAPQVGDDDEFGDD